MTSAAQLEKEFLEHQRDPGRRSVFIDWLEERGDERAAFLRAQDAVWELEPDHPQRLAREAVLSHARLGLEREWLIAVEKERAYLLREQPPRPCACTTQKRNVVFHDEPQDTESAGWRRLLELIDRAASTRAEEFAPLRELSPRERLEVVTLPPEIGRLKSLRRLDLYGSNLIRLPPEVGELESLEEFVPYTSYRLHWFPWELTRSPFKRSTVSTRALYGNMKFRPPFPLLAGLRVAAERACSVCRRQFLDRGEHRRWVSRRVGTDVLPLLVNACSGACLAAIGPLAGTSTAYVVEPHRGGLGVRQPT